MYGARAMPVKVVRVFDGDTVLVQGPEFFSRPFRVRLYGIDAPESAQPFGDESRAALARLVRRQSLALDVFAHDRYGRAVGLLYPHDGDPRESVNVAMVRGGWAYCYHGGGRYSHGLDQAQREARDARLGVWSRPGEERPWRYRRRVAEERAASGGCARVLLAVGFVVVVALALLYVLAGRF